MIRCPNDTYSHKSAKEPIKNQIGRRFSDIFDKLLDPGYYEGTLNGRLFKKIKADGTSKIYIPDPLESKLDELCSQKSNALSYLVGFTGMGKTTLLRNYFKVQNRDVHVRNNELILYISFYYANLNSDHPQKSVENEVIRYFQRAIFKLGQAFPEIVEEDEVFWNNLYDYIETNKPVSLQNGEFTPESPSFNIVDLYGIPTKKTVEQKKAQLSMACRENRIDYYSSMLKYLIGKAEKVQKVYLIFDDIESKEAIFHRPVVEVARHLHSCLSCTDEQDILLKTIVSLRAYTFRSNLDRQLEARREQIERHTIFKKETVELDRIFEARFSELQDILGTSENAKVKTSYDTAVTQVQIVSQQLNNGFYSTILNLANCNLCKAMVMFNSVLVNAEWIAKYETEDSGGFQISADNYRLTSKTVFRALACGNELAYSDIFNNSFPNLLHNEKEEGEELINLLILRYVIRKGATDLYGETYVERCELINDISNIFINNLDSDVIVTQWREKITSSVNYLYDNGILLRSIYDIEILEDKVIERKSSRANKMYASPRGLLLFSLFPQNALLLELYRDSINVDLEGNDRLTNDMKTYEVMQYLILYIGKLFDYEKKYIGEASQNLLRYQEFFGSELLVSLLLEGVVKNIKSYFKEDCNENASLMKMVYALLNRITLYNATLSRTKRVNFNLSSYLNNLTKQD